MGEARRRRARGRQMERLIEMQSVVDFTLSEARALRREETKSDDVLVVTVEPPRINTAIPAFTVQNDMPDKPHTRTNTPAADWREKGEPDPHGNYYDHKKRHEIMGGQFTDDEMAYRCGMASGRDLESISTLHMAKERIRWLSRQLVAAEKRIQELEDR